MLLAYRRHRVGVILRTRSGVARRLGDVVEQGDGWGSSSDEAETRERVVGCVPQPKQLELPGCVFFAVGFGAAAALTLLAIGFYLGLNHRRC